MTYNTNPNAGSGREIRTILSIIGCSKTQINDIMADLQDLHNGNDLSGINNITRYINRAYGSNVVYYNSNVSHWNRGARRL